MNYLTTKTSEIWTNSLNEFLLPSECNNSDILSAVRLNVYKNTCTNDKYFIKSYILTGNNRSELIKQLIGVLSSENCCNWDETLKSILIDQLLLFFNCFKNGSSFEKLLEPPANFCKLLLINYGDNKLLENKYSYMSFFVNLLKVIETYKMKNDKIEHMLSIFPGTGKEIIEILEDFCILTFETEKELTEYTDLELETLGSPPNNSSSSLRNVKRNRFSSTISKNTFSDRLFKFKSADCSFETGNENKIVEFSRMNNAEEEIYKNTLNGKQENSNFSFQKENPSVEIKIENICNETPKMQIEITIRSKKQNDVNILEISEISNARLEIHKNTLNWDQEKCSFPFQKENHNNNTKIENICNERREIQVEKHFSNKILNEEGKNDMLNDGVNQKKIYRLDKSKFCCKYPVIHRCNELNVDGQMCKCSKFTLGMLITIGKGRFLSKLVSENIEELNQKENIISYRFAVIAASALQCQNSATVRRLIIPVVLDILTSPIKTIENDLVSGISGKAISHQSNIFDVTSVLNRLLDQVEVLVIEEKDFRDTPIILENSSVKKRKRNSKVIRELYKLSTTIVNDNPILDLVKSQIKCEQLPPCGKISCLFGCTCVQFKKNGDEIIDTPKEVLKLNDTEDNRNTEIMQFCDRSKREKKLPSRFSNSMLLDQVCLHETVTTFPEKTQGKKRKFQTIDSFFTTNDLRKRSLMFQRRLDFSVGNLQGNKTLADLFIWCNNHEKYSCQCISWVSKMKENLLLWKPEKQIKYVTYKIMSNVSLNKQNKSVVSFYDPEEYSARTFGAPINYNVRNRTEIFLKKRNYELEKEILSSTNSFIKMNFLVYKPVDDNSIDNNISNIDFFNFSGKNIHITKEDDELIVDITTVELAESDIITISDSDEELPIKLDIISDQSNLNGNCIKRDTISVDHFERNKSTKWPVAVKTYLKPKFNHKIIIKKDKMARNISILNRTGILEKSPRNIVVPKQISERKCSTTVETSKCISQNVKDLNILEEKESVLAEKKTEEKISEKVVNNYPNISKIEQQVNQVLSDSSRRTFPEIASSYHTIVKIQNFDPDLENDLLTLSDHPLKDQIYGPDNLPKLALLCRTPGIGYLPIVERTQNMLLVQDPVFPELLHSFKNLNCANIWLNRFLKDFLIFESIEINLKWFLVKPGVIKLKQSMPFSPAILENSSLIVKEDGNLSFKKMEKHGNVSKTQPQHFLIPTHSNNKRKFSQISNENVFTIQNDQRKKYKQMNTFLTTNRKPIEAIVTKLDSKNLHTFTVKSCEINEFTECKQKPQNVNFVGNKVSLLPSNCNNNRHLNSIIENRANFTYQQYNNNSKLLNIISPTKKIIINRNNIVSCEQYPLEFRNRMILPKPNNTIMFQSQDNCL